jgi:hypothetical protein
VVRDDVLHGLCGIRVPDVAGEILGWKMLALTGGGPLARAAEHPPRVEIPIRLCSPMAPAIWPERDWLRASCAIGDPPHEPPLETCTCGIYVLADRDRVAKYRWEASLTVLARIALVGKVVPGTRGWRGERARIVALVRTGAGADDYPGLLGLVAKRYGVPLLDVDLDGLGRAAAG